MNKSGNECFHNAGNDLSFQLKDFWSWAYSDLLSNAARGVLAEFIVKVALGETSTKRIAWDAYDLKVGKTKIEVKSAAYLQSWKQEKLSTIQFDIAPKGAWDVTSNLYTDKIQRAADVYVFCLLHHKNMETVDPMNLEQWTFYVLPTSVLDKKVPLQKKIGLNPLKELGAIQCSFSELAAEIVPKF